MKQKPDALNPCLYLENYVDEFDRYLKDNAEGFRAIKSGERLTDYGVINNTAYYIRKGIMHLSLGHDKGVKGLTFFGPGTLFPIGVERHEVRGEYEMILTAMNDLEAYTFSYPKLKQMVKENGPLGAAILKQNCDFIGYLFFDTINTAFESSVSRIADVFYLYLDKINPHQDVISLSQEDIAQLTGVSLAQVERVVQILRKDDVLQTGRRKILILDRRSLLDHCSSGMKMFIGTSIK